MFSIFFWRYWVVSLVALTMLHTTAVTFAGVLYEEGRRSIQGVTLVRDDADSLLYYYIPQYPRLSVRDDGGFELLCMRYKGAQGQPTGGGDRGQAVSHHRTMGRAGVVLGGADGRRSLAISLIACDGVSTQRQFYQQHSRHVGGELRIDP